VKVISFLFFLIKKKKKKYSNCYLNFGFPESSILSLGIFSGQLQSQILKEKNSTFGLKQLFFFAAPVRFARVGFFN
jgi:hypothetical protein